MKRLILLFVILVSIFAHSQNDEKNVIEEKASFPKGDQVFRTMISENIRTDNIMSNGNQNIHCELTFIIDREGNITDVKAFGDNQEFNKEAEYAISQIQEKWTPAKLNGVAVRARYKVPLDIRFENDETQPTYLTGNENFLNLLREKITLSKIRGREILKCEISFIVRTDGKLIKVRANGKNKSFNKEVIQAISKIPGNWKPASVRGIPMSKWFILSFSINMD